MSANPVKEEQPQSGKKVLITILGFMVGTIALLLVIKFIFGL